MDPPSTVKMGGGWRLQNRTYITDTKQQVCCSNVPLAPHHSETQFLIRTNVPLVSCLVAIKRRGKSSAKDGA